MFKSLTKRLTRTKVRHEIIGPCLLIQGDCLEVLPTLAPGSVDAVVTDPPYGIDLQNHAKGKERSNRDFIVIGDGNQNVGIDVLVWADGHRMPVVVFASPWKPWPGSWRNMIVWNKGGGVGGGGDTATCLKRSWELIQVARNRPINGERSESVLNYYIGPDATADHVCQKPVPVMEWLIEKFTGSGETMFDPFMGVGTTGVACVRTGRHFIGVEVEPKYFDIACRRIKAELRKPQGFLKRSEIVRREPEGFIDTKLLKSKRSNKRKSKE